MTREQAKQPVNVFCSYADQDERLQKDLVKHLRASIQDKLIEIWDRSQIAPGMQTEPEIHRALGRAQIILLLISSDYLSQQGEYHSIEREQAMRRCAGGDVHVIPIILRPVNWRTPPLDKLQALPKRAKPITTWQDRDKAFLQVAEGVRQIVDVLTQRNQENGDDYKALRSFFDHLIVTHTQLFAGRAEIIDKIDKYIGENLNGYIFIEGLSGYGKTSLLAKIVQNHPEFAYHFISQAYSTSGSAFHPTDLEWLAQNLCEQIVEGISEGFNGLRTPTAQFHQLLRTPSPNKAKVIIIDGVDEIDRHPNYLYGLLPTQLPPGVFLLFSARTLGGKNYLREIGLTSENIQLHIDLPGLDASAIHQLLSKAGGQASQYSTNESFIQQLSSVSEGDPFYLRFLIEDVARGKVRPDNQHSIPSGLEAYLDKQFELLARSAYLPQQRMLLGLVIEAHGPLARDELITMIPGLDGINFETVLRDIHRFLLEYNNMFTLCHRRFKEYFYQKIRKREI
ncbi:MAG TPA: TIR domain-containing protein [Ktedonobacteraceae bacterium]|nr:TIR domain-containing protein [Ktedonobacteraceae bacterium]